MRIGPKRSIRQSKDHMGHRGGLWWFTDLSLADLTGSESTEGIMSGLQVLQENASAGDLRRPE